MRDTRGSVKSEIRLAARRLLGDTIYTIEDGMARAGWPRVGNALSILERAHGTRRYAGGSAEITASTG